MKKLVMLALLFALVAVLFTACGGQTEDPAVI